jgi:hypothetical protein
MNLFNWVLIKDNAIAYLKANCVAIAIGFVIGAVVL